MSDYTWLQELKAGDDVYISSSGWRFHSYRLVKVQRVTATQIIINEYARFRKDRGREVGRGLYHGDWLTQYTPELAAEIAETQRRVEVVNILKNTQWEHLATDELEQVEAIVRRSSAEDSAARQEI